MLSYRPSGRPKRRRPNSGRTNLIGIGGSPRARREPVDRRALRRKSAVHPAQGAVNARGSTGEGTCLRSRRLQVQILPGVLCPKQKRAMRRDVDPEKAGSSPVGHPQHSYCETARRRDRPADHPELRIGAVQAGRSTG